MRVPFPHVESDRSAARPALVASVRPIVGNVDLFWALMITSAANRGWPDDISLIERFAECGLRVPCVIRCAKIATLEVAGATIIGRLPTDLHALAMARIGSMLTP